ncbi:MAG: hypothetical protein P8189_13510 [Anaerolineae bacterium]
MRRKPLDPAQRHLRGSLKQVDIPEMLRHAEELPLRQDIVTLLRYVQENKVVGTQTTGNLPLRAVREVTARFVNPPQLDTRIGDRVYRLRTEADVWPLYFLHILAEVGDLVLARPARRWQLTPDGEAFLEMDPLLQLSYLLTTWWSRVNWLVAYPLEGMGEELPPGFEQTVLARLRVLPVGARIPFEEFADLIIEETGLTWTMHSASERFHLRTSIERMVISPLADFGAVTREVREEPLGTGTISELVAFKVTMLGGVLLATVAIAMQSS